MSEKGPNRLTSLKGRAEPQKGTKILSSRHLNIVTESLPQCVTITVTMLQIIYACGVMIIACELGQRINLAFAECGQLIDKFDWYSLTIEIQRMLPIIVNFAQQPIDIKCFGSAACDRDTLKFVSVANQINCPIAIITFTVCPKLD